MTLNFQLSTLNFLANSQPSSQLSTLNSQLANIETFQTFFAAGFECSTFRRRDGTRLDLVASSRHDRFALQDYRRLRETGLGLAREGLRWHLVEPHPGKYDLSTALPIAKAAAATGTQVMWDLCHFGWPDHLELFSPDFIPRLADYGAAFAQWLPKHLPPPYFFVPVNEISFFSWACGDEGVYSPFAQGRGFELKCQLVRAAISAMDAIWHVLPSARFVHVDPIIHVLPHPHHPEDAEAAEAYRLSQYQAWDMLAGKASPELGGRDKYLQMIGVNFYRHNQWYYDLRGNRRVRKFQAISRHHPSYRPFRDMLAEAHQRYGKPIFIAETGAEDAARRSWFRYVCQETQAAIARGIPVEGICLYPILNHPGWDDDRHCRNALWDYPDEQGNREIYQPLARELRTWQKVFEPTPEPRPQQRPLRKERTP